MGRRVGQGALVATALIVAGLVGFVGASLLVAGPQAVKENAPVAMARALVGGNGIDADSPYEIPAGGWWAILRRTGLRILDNRLMTQAGAVTFFALLAIFPAMTVAVSLYGLVANPEDISHLLDRAGPLLPGGAIDVIHNELHHLIAKGPRGLSTGLALGLVVLLWSSNQGSKVLFEVLNVVYRETEKRTYLQFIAVTMAFTLGAIVFVVSTLVAIVFLPMLLTTFGMPKAGLALVGGLRWPAILALLVLFLSSLYRFGPSRDDQKWRWVTWGGALAAIAWIVVSVAFSWYVQNFGSYDKIYGSLGAAVGFITWIWLSTLVILCGAQLNSEMEHQTARDTTVGARRPLGLRGATQADTAA